MQVGGGLLRVNGGGRWPDPVGGGQLQVEVDAGGLIRSPVDCCGTRSGRDDGIRSPADCRRRRSPALVREGGARSDGGTPQLGPVAG
jgi:hypothetical protein